MTLHPYGGAMLKQGRLLALATAVALATPFVCGCADMQWGGRRPDPITAHIDPPHRRIERYRELAKRAGRMSAEDRERNAAELAGSLAGEQDALVRAEMVRTLGKLHTPTGDEALVAAAQDPDHEVRLACCTTWGERDDPEAARQLGVLFKNDPDPDVRLAAVRELGRIEGEASVEALAMALEDPDPAMQWRAVQSLRSASERDLGNDVEAWRRYCKGDAVPPPTIAERLRKIF